MGSWINDAKIQVISKIQSNIAINIIMQPMQTEIQLKKSIVNSNFNTNAAIRKCRRKRTLRQENKASKQYFDMDLQFGEPIRIHSEHLHQERYLEGEQGKVIPDIQQEINPEKWQKFIPRSDKKPSSKTQTLKMSSTFQSGMQSFGPTSCKSGKRNCFLTVYSRLPGFKRCSTPKKY